MMPKVDAANPTAWPLQKLGHGIRLSNVVFAISALFLWFQVLQAPLRYGLQLVHLEALIYLPKLLMSAVVVCLPVLRPRASAPALVLAALMALYFFWGIMNLPSPAQAAFGLWELVPLLFGLWVGSLVRIEKWWRLFFWLFVVTAAGVLLNTFLHYPWDGQIQHVLGKTIIVSRRWETFGHLARYAGFTRISVLAAVFLLMFAMMLVVLLRRRSAKLVVWLIAGMGIALTTDKGILGTWLIASLYFAGGALLRWPRYWIRLWFFALTLSLLAMILLPLSTLLIHYDPNFHGFVNKLVFASFGDRLNWMWPDSLRLLDMGGDWHWWVGRGLGGIGVAQQFFEPAHHFAGDNLFVYVAVSLGLPLALLLFVAWWWRAMKLISQCNTVDWHLPVFMVLAVYGVVMSVMELGVLAFFGGVFLTSLPMVTYRAEKSDR